MTPENELQRTPLFAEHQSLGARIVPFAGWEMPIQYAGVIDEHMSVRQRVGLFDVSHMGEAVIEGPQSLDLLQLLTCNNVAKLRAGRAHYTALTTPAGTFVDDLLIYDLGEGRYFLVLNAANTAKDLAWMRQYASDYDVEVRDESSEWAQLALQGPQALTTLGELTTEPIAEMGYYRFVRAPVAGVECLLSRTGYTGEDGFELYCAAASAPALWRAVLEAGRTHGIAPIGLAARDTLRLEAKMALYGNDIDDSTTVIEADLGWIVKLKKGEFLGRDVLARQKEHGIDRKLVGFEMRGRGIARRGYAAFHSDREVGRVTSGSHAPYLKRNIGLVYLPTGLCDPGAEFEVEIRARREPAVVVPTPFYQRPKS